MNFLPNVRRTIPALICLSLLIGFLVSPCPGHGIKGKQVVGYADRLSVQASQTIRFMVSCELPQYRADIVRLIHGNANLAGPGLKEKIIETPVNKEYPGRHQELPEGSYVLVSDTPTLRLTGSFTIQAWVAPTTLHKGVQGIVTKWSADDEAGYGLFLDRDGNLAVWLGDGKGRVEKVRSSRPLRASVSAFASSHRMVNLSNWYFVAATFDAEEGKVVLYQEPVHSWPIDESRIVREETTELRSLGWSQVPLLMAAYWKEWEGDQGTAGGHFNGKIDSLRLFGRALTRAEIGALKRDGPPRDPVAAWDFSADISSRKVADTSPNRLHGRTVHMPARGVTGHNWRGDETDFLEAPGEYGAIHFHDDDLDDAGWEVDFEFQVPTDLESGVYAARLRAGKGEDHVPFFVRPRKGMATAPIALLIPTFSYLAYGNFEPGLPRQLLSLYDHHSDGSGVFYASRLRPILNMRPDGLELWRDSVHPHQLSADLHLVDWLHGKDHRYDVITDEDLHLEGAALLAPYKVVVTGSHPEYWSGQMLDGLQQFLSKGGRLMYLGGNGFYWVTSMDPEGHTIEIRRRAGTQTWEAAAGEYHHSTTGELGGLWRFRGRPPQQLVGVGFSALGPEPGRPYRRQPGSFDPRAAFIFEGIEQDELIGDFPSLVREFGAAAIEVDRFEPLLGSPPHALILATASGFSDQFDPAAEERGNASSDLGREDHPLVRADMVYFEYPNGGAVFSVGSQSWCGALSYLQRVQ